MTTDEQAPRGAQVLGAIALFVVVGGFVVIFDRWIMPPSRPNFAHPSAIDVLIDSRLEIGILRLTGVIFAIYVVGSIVALCVTAVGLSDSDRPRQQNWTAKAEG